MVALTCSRMLTAAAMRSALPVVEQASPPAGEPAPRQQDRHLGLAVGSGFCGELESRTCQAPVRAFDDVEWQPRQTRAAATRAPASPAPSGRRRSGRSVASRA